MLIRIENPIVVVLALAAIFIGVVIVPYLQSRPVRFSGSKVLAICIAVSYCLFQRSIIPALIVLWPLSLICFPEYWARFQGSINGPYINQQSPPWLVAAFGWLFLIAYAVLMFLLLRL